MAPRRVDLDFVAQIEAHSVRAWPPVTVEREEGWTLRATPGLQRGRSSHALTPSRRLTNAELDQGLAAASRFADRHDIELGVQISPLDVHATNVAELADRGWQVQAPVAVLTVEADRVAEQGDKLELTITDQADPAWLHAWGCCEPARLGAGPGIDIASHTHTVFPLMAGHARFCRFDDRAAGIAVAEDGLVGLFCLAVAPQVRRQGLGKALVRSMLATVPGSLAYLQVFSENLPGIALYDSLGFEHAYSYRHCVAPPLTR